MNVLGTRSDGYHEVQTLMHAISLADLVTVEASEHNCNPADFEYEEADLAWRAAYLMAQTFRPTQVEQAQICGIHISIDKHIPAAAGLGGGSSDAAAVMVGLAKAWELEDSNEALLELLVPLGAKLGSDVPFCIAANLGFPAAIATGTGIQLRLVRPINCGISLYFSDRTIPNKTRAVYAELTEDDCRPVYDIEALLSAETPEEIRACLGNHLQAPAERLMKRFGIELPDASGMILCGAGPTYFSICRDGPYHTITG